MTLPTPKTDVGTLFNKRLVELAEIQTKNGQAALNQGAAAWCRPAEITKSYNSDEGNKQVGEVFSRQEQEKWFDEATKNPKDRGTRGDFYQIQLQGDFLACMERAYRTRHLSTLRSRIHPAARLEGTGHEYGVIRQGILGYITGIDLMNKGETI